MMTQKERILRLLKEAGNNGVHSFEFYKMYLPRAAARVNDLRNEGYDIESKQEGQGVRYILFEEEQGSLL